MSKQNKIFVGVILVVVILLAIGYAAVGNITLLINGTAQASAVSDNFKVYFTAQNTNVSDAVRVNTMVTAQTTSAEVNISGLNKAGDSEYAILEIENGSNDIDAESVNVTTGPVDTSIFDLETVMCDSTGNEIQNFAVLSGEKTYVKVSATLKKTPTDDVNTSITATITAVPAAVTE